MQKNFNLKFPNETLCLLFAVKSIYYISFVFQSHDKRNLPKVEVNVKQKGNLTVMHYSCVENCQQGYVEIFNRCWVKNANSTEASDNFSIFQKLSQQLIITWPYLVAVCGISFVFSYIVLILFRYFIEYVIWIIYILFVGMFACAAGFCWYAYVTAKDKDKKGMLIIAILFTIGVVLFVLLLILNRRRIKLVAQIFKEASKAIIDVPALLFEPVITFLALAVAFFLFVYFAIVTETTGTLEADTTLDGEFQAKYEPNFAAYMSRIFNILAFIWFTQFIFGCQNFLIAGTVVKWYFSRDKSKVDSPIQKTFLHLVRFHLGSICLGSILLLLMKILKLIVDGIKQQTSNSTSFTAQCLGCLCSCLIEKLDQFLQYLMRNAYIIMAKDGTPFFESGKRAFNLIFRNLKNVLALNNFGDLVLFMGRLFVVLIAGLCGYALMSESGVNIIFPMILAIIFAYFIANCFISVFEMTIDTIFVCYCEDCEENDGISRPYFMSIGLKESFEELKNTAERKFRFGKPVGIEAGNERRF
ncbi:hypothetical protein ACKWTF_010379 [Chironomus riparius]